MKSGLYSAGMNNASIVIAQINPKMIKTGGDSSIHLDEIDYLVCHEEPIVEYLPDRNRDSQVAKRIGLYVAQMIDDGATLQVGFGSLPGQILQSLLNKKDLGIHTQVITDAFLPLLKEKAITCKKKNYLPGRIVGSLCMGRNELYEYVDGNPLFYFRSSEFVNDPNIIAKNDKLISISSALEADLTGQVCSDSVGHLFYSGIGDQVDFLRGSAMSKGGFSIIALPSTAQNGKISRIVPFLNEGAGVATTRGDVNYVVTEYGVAALKGKSIYQRAMEMAQIAHPKFREELIKQAKKLHYIFVDQIPPSQADLIFLEDYKTSHKLRDGRSMELRPIMPSDEFSSRNFYYSLQERTIYHRFFHKRKIFGHQEVQNELANVDYHQNMTLIGLVVQGGHKEIMAVASYAQEIDSTLAEVAFVVGENFQGLGVASIMMSQLEKIARQNSITGFTAIVLKENLGMQHVCKKRYPDAKIHYISSELHFTMIFDL